MMLSSKSLETLSLASNRLRFIGKNYFFFLYSLKLLNLTRNEIVFIENDAFCNLNKLNTLDLSSIGPFLKFIEANLFQGLNYLNDLHLNALNVDATLNDSSFNYLSNIGNIYLDWNIVSKYQCLFMNAIVHDVRRKVGGMIQIF